MKEKVTKNEKINLRNLDDVQCSNVVVSRQIRRLIRKFPHLRESFLDCWIHGGHDTKFEYCGPKFIWHCEPKDPHLKGAETLSSDDEFLTDDELNKLIVFTYQAMCDTLNGVDLTDTPEDLLAYAEQKLQEMISDDAETDLI